MGRNRPKGGALGGFDQLRAPDAPTISVAKDTTSTLVVTITNPSDVGGGAITSYVATAIASGVSTGVTSASSPVTITGLTNATTYSVTALANNAFGVSPYSEATSITVGNPDITQQIGLFSGGRNSSTNFTNVIQQRNLASTGNASDFGDLTDGRYGLTALGNTTRGIMSGGVNGSYALQNIIEYVTFSSAGNATDFGDLSAVRQYFASASNHTRGVFGGGEGSGSARVNA